MSMPSLKEHIYSSHLKTTDAQHSLMHIIFLVMRSKPSRSTNDIQCGVKLFNKLLEEFFTSDLEVSLRGLSSWHSRFIFVVILQLQSECPRLDNLIYAVAEKLVVVNQTTDKDQIRHILEGVLAHFFSAYRGSYDREDIMLFLRMANRQTTWLATYGMDEVIDVSYPHKIRKASLKCSILG